MTEGGSHNYHDHYFMDSVPGYEEEATKSKKWLDFNKLGGRKRELFEKYKDRSALEVYEDVYKKTKSLIRGFDKKFIDVHDLANFYQYIANDYSVIERRGLSGTLEELASREECDVDKLLQAMIDLGY